MKTKAAVLYGFNQALKIEDVELDEPKDGEVVVRLVGSGICHTDVKVMHGDRPMQPVPAILGHEGSGIVDSVGPGVTRIHKGDHVIVSGFGRCGQCNSCLRGKPYWCTGARAAPWGGTMADGTRRFRKATQEISHFFGQSSFSQYIVVPETGLFRVSKDLPLDKLGPLACGISTGAGAVLNLARVRPGESAAVFGLGGVGMSALMAAKIAGAQPLIAVDIVDSRLELATKLGATDVINAKRVNPAEEIRKMTGSGVDYSFECIGREETILQAIDSVRMGGQAIISGIPASGVSVSLDIPRAMSKSITVNSGGNTVPELFLPTLLEFWQRGQFPFDELTKSYSLDEINVAIAEMESGVVIKPLIRF